MPPKDAILGSAEMHIWPTNVGLWGPDFLGFLLSSPTPGHCIPHFKLYYSCAVLV